MLNSLQQWGQNIREARQRQAMTQLELADSLGIRQSSVCRWEHGTAAPNDCHKVALARMLDEDASDLFPT